MIQYKIIIKKIYKIECFTSPPAILNNYKE